jgi:predicted ATP-grasp superfamily ATP-dependent carboligase
LNFTAQRGGPAFKVLNSAAAIGALFCSGYVKAATIIGEPDPYVLRIESRLNANYGGLCMFENVGQSFLQDAQNLERCGGIQPRQQWRFLNTPFKPDACGFQSLA